MAVKRFLPGVLTCLLAGCSGGKPPAATTTDKAKPKKIAMLNAEAPPVYRVRLDTSKGDVVIEVNRDWAPKGADRFYNLVQSGFYDGNRFFRVVSFVAQFGINGDPATSRLWANLTIPDDPVKQKNRRGMVTFAQIGKDSRRTQVFMNIKDNRSLDSQGFAPFGKVVAGMEEVVDHLYFGYGDMPPRGAGPDPTQIELRGNSYLDDKFPRLDFIKKAVIEK
jgi:peptidyl-prolyl cis-trans isomerase A (cyclophilin A)